MYDAHLQVMIAKISQAAIESTLAHLGYEADGVGGFEREYVEWDAGTTNPGGLGERPTMGPMSKWDRIPAGGTTVAQPVDPTLRGGEQFVPAEIFSYWNDTIRALFEPFRDVPDPGDYDPYLSNLLGALAHLSDGTTTDDHYQGANTELADMATVNDYLTLWQSQTAYHFQRNYTSRFEMVHSGQYHLARMVYIGLLAEQETWRRLREDVSKLLDGSLPVFVAAKPQEPDFSFKDALKLVGAVLSVVSPFLAGAAATAVGGAQTGVSLLSTFAVSDPSQQRDVEFTGAHPNDVYAELVPVVEQLKTDLERSERDIARQFDGLLSEVIGAADSFYLQRPRELIGTVDPTQVYSPADEINLDPEIMLDVGQELLPNVAQVLAGAAGRLESGIEMAPFRRGSGLGMGDIGPYTAWASLARHLVHLIDDTATNLDDAAAMLVVGIKEAVAHDEAVSAEMSTLSAQLEGDWRRDHTPADPAPI